MTRFRLKTVVFLAFVALFFAVPGNAKKINPGKLFQFGTVSGVVDRRPHIIQSRTEGHKWFLATWSDQNKFTVQSFDGKLSKTLLEVTLPEQGAVGATGGITETSEGIFAVWWVRDEAGSKVKKRIMAGFIPHKPDGSPITVRLSDEGGEPLPQVAVASSESKVLVIWQDERRKKYTLNANISEDGGKTFLSKDFVVVPEEYNPGEPVLAVDSEHSFHLIFKGSKDEKFGIFYTTSQDGKTWSTPERVVSPEGWAPAYLSIAFVGNKPYVFWAGARGVHYAIRREAGKWQEASVPGVPQNPVNRLEIRSAGSTLFLLTDFAQKEEKRGFIPEFGNRASIYLFKMKGDQSWEGPVPIRHYPYDTTSAVYGDLYVSPDGGVIAVAWQDFRLIRSNIFVNYSVDGGKTWQEEDINISENPGCDNEFYPFLFAEGKSLHLFWPEYPDDSLDGTLVKFKYREVNLP